MKRITLLLAFAICIEQSISAQTNVSGYILTNTTWTLAGSPYRVTGNALVVNGVTLTIEPGVTVKFDTTKALQIDGELIAIGTAQSRIAFTATDSTPVGGSWGRIQFSSNSTDAIFDTLGNYVSGSIMKYCDIRYGGYVPGTTSSTVYCDTAAPYFTNCRITDCVKGIGIVKASGRVDSSSFRNCGDTVLSISYADSVDLIIKNDTVENNVKGISCSTPANVHLQDCIFTGAGNSAYATGEGRVTVQDCIFTQTGVIANAGGITIQDCSFTGAVTAVDVGLTGFNYYGTAVLNTLITNNVFTSNTDAIKGRLGDATISNNVFTGQTNSVIGTAICYGGYFSDYSAPSVSADSLSVINNHFENNKGVIYVNSSYAAKAVIQGNTFLNNQFLTYRDDNYCRGYSSLPYYYLINIFNSPGILTNNVFDGNTSPDSSGTLIRTDSHWEIANNMVRNNSPGNLLCTGVPTICSNKFLNNSGNVIATSSSTSYYNTNQAVFIHDNNFLSNSATSGTVVSVVNSDSSVIINNEFQNNSSDNSILSIGTSSVSNNKFLGNLTTGYPLITTAGNSNIEHNDFLSNSGPSCLRITGNTSQPVVRQNNFINPGMQYEIENQIPFGPGADFNMPDNYWGTASTAHIDSVIKDYFDNANLSVVYYFPLLTVPAFVDTNAACVTCAMSLNGTVRTPYYCYGNYYKGSIDLTVYNAALPLSYSWSNGKTNEDVNDLVDGTYTVTVTDAYSCSDTASFTLIARTALAVTGVVTKASCNVGGSIDITVTGGVTPYTYQWNNGAITDDVTALIAGSYSVTVRDSTGCTANKYFTVAQTTGPTVTRVVTNPNCYGGCDGAINLTVTGNAPFTYDWGNGFGASEDTSGLCSGTYNVTVSDSTNCTTSATYTLANGFNINAGVIVGLNSATLNGTYVYSINASGTYGYNWNVNNGTLVSGQSTNSVEVYWGVLGQGVVQVIVSAQGCADTLSKTVTVVDTNVVPGPYVTGVITNASCYGRCDGAINLTVVGNAPFTYNWGNGFGASEDTSRLCAGAYMVTVSDSNNRTTSATFFVTSPAELSPSASVVASVSCSGYDDGAAMAEANGGTPPYSFLWSDGQTADTATGLSAGTIDVTVTDASGCTAAVSLTIPDGVNLYAGAIVGFSTSEINQFAIYSVSANFNYSYDWSISSGTIVSGQGTNSIEVLWDSVGQAQVQLIISAQGCSDTISKMVTVLDATTIPAPVISGVVTDASCYGSCDGAINLTVTGTPPFTYNWGNGFGTSEDTSGLCAGTYSVMVADSANRQASATFTIANGINIYVGAIVGFNTAEINQPAIYSVNANFNYIYDWSVSSGTIVSGQGTNIIEVSWNSTGQGIVQVIASDRGCADTVSKSITVTDTAQNCSARFFIYPDTIPHRYFAINTASGIPPLSYVWNWGDGTTDTIAYPSHTYSIAGFYTICLSITDSAGCTDSYCNPYYLFKAADELNDMIYVNVYPPTFTGVLNEVLEDIFVFPNPTSNSITLKANGFSSETTLGLFDAMGKQLLHQFLEHNELKLGATMDLTQVDNGLYFLRIQTDKGSRYIKVIKQ